MRKRWLFLFQFILLVAAIQLIAEQSLDNKIEGMLIGSAIGDAAGGPVEFITPIQRSFWCTTDKKLTDQGIKELGELFKLRDYPKDAEPFAQWEPYAPKGTITDDTRFKMIFFNTLKHHDGNLTLENFANEVLNYRNYLSDNYKIWYDRWIPEIEYATRWALGERKDAYPTERIWGGIPTMEGQMPFLPIAVLYSNNPEAAYLKTWELGYFDVGLAKDINSALVAGLTSAFSHRADWSDVEKTMRNTDPYKFGEVLYVPRKSNEWLDKSHDFVRRANGNISKLFDILEKDLQTQTWWEAWVPVVVVFSCAEIVNYDPMASMQLMMEFGHDTDSYAQVMGAILGAIHGKDIFPKEMRATVNNLMKKQFGQNVDDWMELITEYKRENDE